MTTITDFEVLDVRFPTSTQLDGSDAMNPDPDYSAAYVILKTDNPALSGHGLTFTIGRGNDICCQAIEAMRHLVVGLNIDDIKNNPAKMWRDLTSRQRCNAPGNWRCCERYLGFVGKKREKTGLAIGC
jgi:L-fuconate dehydratase